MAKKRRKKSSKCPEPFNTLIDLAAAATLDYVAYKRRQKRGGSKTKIDPYAAAGAAYGMGLIDDTEDLIKLGGMLGAMGAFDDDDNGSYTPVSTNNRNKYAWRMNCEDGSDYGIYPENYETRQEYNEAIVSAKSNEQGSVESIKINRGQEHNDSATEIKYTFCKISRIDNGKNDYYFPGELCLRVGDFVKVPTEVGESNAIVIHIQAYSESEVPKPINETEQIIEKMF